MEWGPPKEHVMFDQLPMSEEETWSFFPRELGNRIRYTSTHDANIDVDCRVPRYGETVAAASYRSLRPPCLRKRNASSLSLSFGEKSHTIVLETPAFVFPGSERVLVCHIYCYGGP